MTLLTAIELIGWIGLALLFGGALYGLTWSPRFPDPEWESFLERQQRFEANVRAMISQARKGR